MTDPVREFARQDAQARAIEAGDDPVDVLRPPPVPQVKRDVCGMVYDSSWTDGDGVTYYTRDRAGGTAGGPARWSSEHDCNPICGCHLARKCTGCNGCLTCDGCYCNED